uniref:THAP-type domain-containing protein n=1 Tax=Ixodes ricinus TaxID=34613 RepID=A0A6B0UNU1_IXORI
MVCCCAVGCSNSNRKGFRLFLIPREIKRRELWLAKIRRDKWTPTSGSRLCEINLLSSKGARTPEPSAPNFLEEKNNVPLLQMRTRATQVYFRSVSTQTNSSARSAGVQVNLELLGSQYAR